MFDMVKAERFCHIYTGIEDSCEHGSRDEIPCGVWGRAPPIQITNSEYYIFLVLFLEGE